MGGLDVVHDVHMNVIENDDVGIDTFLTVVVVSRVQIRQFASLDLPLVYYVTEDNTSIGRRDWSESVWANEWLDRQRTLDSSLQIDKVVRTNILRWWTLNDLEVA